MTFGKAPHSPPDRENLTGLVERMTFHNKDNGFSVLQVRAWGRRDVITIIGHAAAGRFDRFTYLAALWSIACTIWLPSGGRNEGPPLHF